MSDVHDMSYYAKCMVGGIFACGITHAAVCPLDIVKCRRQVSTKPESPLQLCPGNKCLRRTTSKATNIDEQLAHQLSFLYRHPLNCTQASPMDSGRSTPPKA